MPDHYEIRIEGELAVKGEPGSLGDAALLHHLLDWSIGGASTPAAIFFGSPAVLAFIFSAHFVLEPAHGGIQ